MGRKKGGRTASSSNSNSTKPSSVDVDIDMEASMKDCSTSKSLMLEIKKLQEEILNPQSTLKVAAENPGLLIAILDGLKEEEDYVRITLALSKLVWSYPCARRFAGEFFRSHGSPLRRIENQLKQLTIEEPRRKRLKTLSTTSAGNSGLRGIDSEEDFKSFLKALLMLMKKLPHFVYSSWDLEVFFTLKSVDNKIIRWYALSCLSLFLRLPEVERQKLLQGWRITNSEELTYSLETQREIESIYDVFSTSLDKTFDLCDAGAISVLNETHNLTSIGGLIVKSKPCPNREAGYETDEVVLLPSFIHCLKDIALCVTNCSPVCVVGPIGSGKSTLIRHLAYVFGRDRYPDFISVQMSDQIDSRLLLGSYHTTDLPGQFVWKPGCLTKAILNGHWIVFEDLDSAPMDVITLLEGFIDSKRLSVPGYGEINNAHPDFRVFATCRTHNVKARHFEKVGKTWEKIFINCYCPDDMKLMVKSLYPHLRSIVDRLVDTFEAMTFFSKDRKTGSSSSRPLSIRDFLKFCQRIPKDMDFTQTSTAIAIFQEGLDLFVSSLTGKEPKETVAEIIGTHLNLLEAKTEYYVNMYKPHVSICSKSNSLICGRFTLPVYKPLPSLRREEMGVYSLTKRTCCMLETISGSIKNKEPVLLIGETGVGKTSCVQYLAKVLHQKLVVVNLNRQSDSADLLGGYKPVELKYIFLPLREEFEILFAQCFDLIQNSKYSNHIMTCYANKRWKDLVRLMKHVKISALDRCQRNNKRDLFESWTAFYRKLSRVEAQMFDGEESPFAFSFIEGTLINAITNGYWILLDEINLATSEMLQCLSGVLDEKAQIHLWEKGDDQPIQRHPNFHLFAAMNPSTDVGKKDLPLGIRNRFTELYVGELDDKDELRILVSDYLKEMSLTSRQISKIVEFYLEIRKRSQSELVDGLGKKPHFSLRTLCRALKISSMNLYGSIKRSLYESFCLSFLTQLDFVSHPIVEQLIAKYIFEKNDIKSIVNQALPCPANGNHVKVEGYWIPQGELEPKVPDNYILTTSVRRNLKDIVRIVSAGKLPVLIQGETSVGKTSLIKYLADCSGNKCYRINNHQHTDLQEYIGSYQSDAHGKLVFTEGVLVQAMRRGEWVILDELNLAPSEVLEALNRLLDDNRQLFITETGVTVTAHPRFMLFATQNPPGLYGGRKVLSRAFRNRFVELHFDEIPCSELEHILHLRCAMPVSYCKKIIGVMKDLQIRRKASAALQGKHGFATLRDLFRWAERYRLSEKQEARFYDWDQHVADEGYLVLAGKERKPAEADVIREVLEANFKKTVDPNNLFSLHENTSTVTRAILEKVVLSASSPEFSHIVWTYQMRRLAVLIKKAMDFKEPILLVGETGCGKTTVVQLLSQLRGRELYSINCHMNSEGSDFLGGLRPVRDHSEQNERLFEWVNGPLVDAMENGGIFLADEISLADDSVLERINSVLEPERSLLMAEKGEEIPRLVIADENFHFVGTMNPGGDYGKKELSPALRNRLTEIWCELTTEEADLIEIVEHNLVPDLKRRSIGYVMTSFMSWLKNNELGQRCTISIRDYLSWVNFINYMTTLTAPAHRISLAEAVVHGACLAFLDGLGTGNTSTENHAYSLQVRNKAIDYLKLVITERTGEKIQDEKVYNLYKDAATLQVGPFSVNCNPFTTNSNNTAKFAVESPTTLKNTLRLLRAMQLKKPILLEGSPGVGKTALVSALAAISGNSLTRINLSEQTDISDLFGADLPVEGKEGGHFEWRDGPLLQALKNNSWILLDELNLASQSVLEGLNACLDHRGSVFIPELNKTFRIFESHDAFNFSRIFGCQNPVRQGGARKGLPKSFLNRFTQVYMDSLTVEDFSFVLQSSFPMLPDLKITAMSIFASRLHEQVCQRGVFGAKGSPWDINLRDLMRWAQLTVSAGESENVKVKAEDEFSPEFYVDLVYGLRMRSSEDRRKVIELFCKVYEEVVPGQKVDLPTLFWGQNETVLLEDRVVCGKATLERTSCAEMNDTKLLVLQKDLSQLEAIMACLKVGWMPILVGSAGSGKTSLIKVVSELCGRKLQIMHPSPEMDTIELLGGFEQADIYRRIDEIRIQICEIVMKFVKELVLSDAIGDSQAAQEILQLWSSIKALSHITPEEGLGHDEEIKRIGSRVDFLYNAYLRCKSFSESESRNPGMLSYETEGSTGESRVLTGEHEHLERVSRELEQIYTHLKASKIQTGAFQWIDSLLIKALVNGEWLLIDGANRCSAAVLDRLNSLMEPNGSILLSERGCIDGNILEIKPHSEFRLILTLDPIYGEISRAMRNRGVEIYMSCGDNPGTLVEGGDCQTVEAALGWTNEDINPTLLEFGINSFDLDALLRAEGLRDRELRKEIVNLHREIRDTVTSSVGHTDEHSQLFKVLSSAKYIVLQLQQGIQLAEAVRRALLHVYCNSGKNDAEQAIAIEAVVSNLIGKDKKFDSTLMSSKGFGKLPMLPISLPNFMNSQLYRVWKHLEVLESCMDKESCQIYNQYGERSSKELLEDFLILSVFSRVVKQDASALSMALGLRYPLKASFVSKLANVLDSTEFESFVDWKQRSWDIQELPHVIAKFSCANEREKEKTRHLLKTVKTSIRLHYQNQIFHENSTENPKKGSLGFVVKNVKFSDAGTLSEFLHCFWNLVVNFNSISESCLNERSSTCFVDPHKRNVEEYAKLWLDGMKIPLWGKRLRDLIEKKCTSKLPNEKLIANINLLVQWIHEKVLPVLSVFGGISSMNEMNQLVEKCFKTSDHCRDRVLLQQNMLFRKVNEFRPFLTNENVKAIGTLFGILSTAWSSSGSITPERLIAYFSSSSTSDAHISLVGICAKVLRCEIISKDEVNFLNQLADELNKIKSCNEDAADLNPLSESSENLFALEEFLRIVKKPNASMSSVFVNPLLLAWQEINGVDVVTRFFDWEDGERFRRTFTKVPIGMVQNACLLPVFGGRLLLDCQSLTYKVPTLESNGVVERCQRKMLSTLTSEITKPSDDFAITSHFLVKQCDEFIQILDGWKNAFISGSPHLPTFDHWKLQLEMLRDEHVTDKELYRKMARIGIIIVEASSSLMEVASYLPIVDPAVEKEVLAEYLDEEINYFENWVTSKRLHQLSTTGFDILKSSINSTASHPYLGHVVQDIISIREESKEARAGIVPRPDPPSYSSIHQDIKQFVSTIGSLAKVKDLTHSVVTLFDNNSSENADDVKSVLVRCQNWLDSHRHFIHKVSSNYWYWDVTAGFLYASVQASNGFNLIYDAVRRYHVATVDLRESILAMVQFPKPYVEKSINPSGLYAEVWAYQRAKKRIFLASLVSYCNKICVQQRLSTQCVVQLQNYCLEIAKWWNAQEEEKQRQKDEEDAMCVFKGKERAMERTDEEQEAYDLANTFPSFQEEFQDLKEVEFLEDGFKSRKLTEDKLVDCGQLTAEDVSLFLNIHGYAVSHVSNSWLAKKSDERKVDFITPFMNVFEIGCFGFNEGENVSIFDREQERDFMIGANVAAHQISIESKTAKWDPATYDFYHDPNVAEAQRLQSVFKSMKERVSELMTEWPDHPALQQIVKIIVRIESFRLDSPIMKFLTGLELLLATAQEWEGVASQRVSVSANLAEITTLIISWRKLELRFWKNLSEHSFIKEQHEAKKWWFHLFSATMQIIYDKTDDMPSVLKLFHQFMECCPIGQFKTRLLLLENLHRHITLLESHRLLKLDPAFQSYLWNTICYYKQFDEPVSSKLNALKTPIEKKMKDFVKISRWNDANFYALQDSVKKSQKMLNKLISEYSKVLKTPVSTVLVAEIGTEGLKKQKDKLSKFKNDLYVLPANQMNDFNPQESLVQDFSSQLIRQKRFRKLPKLFSKVRGFTEASLNNSESICREKVSELDELTGTIIEKVHELQNLHVPDKGNQRKKALHNVHNLRRKNLAELFKALQGLNLSYKKGLIHIQNFENETKVPYDFLMDPMDITAGWSHFIANNKKLSADKEIVLVWKGCEEYFQKCIARISVMMKSFQNPSKELGLMIIERCKGFTSDLFTLVCDQKSFIGKCNRSLWELKVLSDLSPEESQLVSKNWDRQFFEKACIVEYEISQYQVVFESLTDFSPDVKERLMSGLKIIVSKLKDVKLLLRECFESLTTLLPLDQPASLQVLNMCEQSFQQIANEIRKLAFQMPNSLLGEKILKLGNIIIEFLIFKNDNILSCNEMVPNNIPEVSGKFKNAANGVLESILLTFQKLQLIDTSDASNIDIRRSLSLQHLQSFDLEKVAKGCSVMRSVMSKESGYNYKKMGQIFAALKPFLQQYAIVGQFYLKSLVEYHRESCKLLSVLSALFGTLAQKGFCLPSDYEQEAMEEGAELDAKSGMGLGEGDTTSDAKDVSDRLESEDQLEDTMKAGESAKPADKDLNDDEKGVEMSEDFEGKQQDEQQRNKQEEDNNDDKSDEEEEDLDKQMGDVDGENQEALDDQMWGGSSDEEDEDMDDEKEENGKGMPQKSEPQLAPKDPSLENKDKEESDANPSDDNQKEQKEKDYNEMDEGEINDDQVDPYHGQNGPEEEPEALDLPDDLQLDDAEAKDDEPQEENPFDLDANEREDFPELDEPTEEGQGNEDGEKEISDDEDQNDEDASHVDVELPDKDEDVESKENNDKSGEVEEPMDVDENVEGENPEDEEKAANKDSEAQKTEDVQEPSKDKDEQPNAQTSAPKDQQNKTNAENTKVESTEEEQSKSNDEQASGQVESEEGTGHEGQALNQEKAQATKRENDKDATRKPGETDSERALAPEQNTKTRLKTVKQQNKDEAEEEGTADENNEDEINQKEADLYQHIKSAEKADALTVDNATQEQAEKQQKAESTEPSEEMPKIDETQESEKDSDSEMEDLDKEALEKNKPDLIRGLPQEKKRPKKERQSEEQMEEKVDVEGEKALTHTVQRPAESVFETQFKLLEEPMDFDEDMNDDEMKIAEHITAAMTRGEDVLSMSQWHDLDRNTMSLSQELCEQLRLILEPTQASRLKGDYKTGKRLNMRKVIAYIASSYRKDKIWLRRTQASKREYQILLALDDSSSMCDNQCKEMAFSAVAVVARALTLLEAGQLAVVSFGKDVQLLHPFEEPFTDISGARLMQKFTFAQRQTQVAKLMEYSCALFNHAKQMSGGSSAPVETAQLLLIISDGRAVNHGGIETVKMAVRKAREQNIFIVFVIVDNPQNKRSILDIQQPIFKEGKVELVKYMDNFPFPFYVILRDLPSLPSVLSDALRQWFELVTSGSR